MIVRIRNVRAYAHCASASGGSRSRGRFKSQVECVDGSETANSRSYGTRGRAWAGCSASVTRVRYVYAALSAGDDDATARTRSNGSY